MASFTLSGSSAQASRQFAAPLGERLQSSYRISSGLAIQLVGVSPKVRSMVDNLLVIVPCGHAKIWDKNPQAGPTTASPDPEDTEATAPDRVN